MSKKSQNHIDCGTALEWIHLLLDKELPPLDHQKLQAHLQSCPNCSTAFRELSLIENAHGVLDRSLDTVASGYFEELPGRVMGRLALAEKRAARTFSLPKPQLPKWQMPPGWRHVIFGRGKYALAFAAVMLLTFVITRQLRQDFSSTSVRLEQSPEKPAEPVANQMVAPPAQTESKALHKLTETQEIAEKSEAEAPAVARELLLAPATPAPAAESGARMAGQTQPGSAPDQEAGERHETAAQAAPQAEADLARAERQDTGSAAVHQFSALDALGKQPALSSQNAAGAATRSSGESHAPARSEPAKMSLQSRYSAVPVPENDFQRTSRQARQANSEQERRKIWQQFLNTKPDSVHYYLAATEIGRSFAAEIDSASTRAQIEEAIQFYDTVEKALGTYGSGATFAEERRRLESLLHRKNMR